jgi:hypothetical protein
MKNILLTSALAVILILTAAPEQNDKFVYQQVLSIDSVQTIVKNGKIRLNCTASVPDPCFHYSHFKSVRNENLLTVTPFAKREKNVNCIQILARIKFELNLDVEGIDQIEINTIGKPYPILLNENKMQGCDHEKN